MNQALFQMRLPQQQQGAALMVGLVMLLVLTLLGVSNMRMTTLELRMSANTQNRNQAFQAAASAIAPALENFNSANIDPLAPETFIGVFSSGSADSSADAVVTYQGRTSGSGCPGTSFRFDCIHFEIQATGRHNGSNAVS
ncbi:MAG: PilX N-terminal domain-containing pilus assembly protein, partial [Gammaproteobacteria bacterium]|nr:PilX N-terminal domain-containing pilus assembly protein [Gammaproteobacteria bacterium]